MSTKSNAMREGGARLGAIKRELYDLTRVGISPKELEAKAMELIKGSGGQPSFTRVRGYKWATCINVNDGVVHGIPTSGRAFRSGDVVTLDVGLYYQGYHTDTSFSKAVGTPSPEVVRFLRAGEDAIEKAIGVVEPNVHLGEVSRAIQETIEGAGYTVSRHLTGHGVGKRLHEDPMIPGYLEVKVENTPRLTVGQTIAIEVIYMAGGSDLQLEPDGWTITTVDGKIASVFEETVEVTRDGHCILTRLGD